MKKTLIQLDTDQRTSVFDSMVAIDSGIDFLIQQAAVTPDNVEGLVHGAIFTRGADQLRHTALFIGGSDVISGEQVLRRVCGSFFGPLRTSVMLDSNGSNTTAVAAVLSIANHLDLGSCRTLVLGGTGPVGLRVARILASRGATVVLGSRSQERAESVVANLRQSLAEESQERGQLEARQVVGEEQLQAALEESNVVVSAGAAGICLWPRQCWPPAGGSSSVQVAVDLNAVPPSGIEAIEATDKAEPRDGILCYGAIGVGGLKMKIHRAAVARLFTSNDQVLDTEQIFQLGQELVKPT